MEADRRSFLRGALAGGGLFVADAMLAERGGLARPKPPFPELSLSGSPAAIGEAHGRAFARQIKHNIAFYLGWFKDVIKLEPTRALRIARGFVPVLKRYAPEILQEIWGIARGAGVDRYAVLAVNARTDMLVMGRRRGRSEQRLESMAMPGCTALALAGNEGEKKLLALGQNWDWRRALAGNTVLLRVARKGAPKLVTFTEAGMVGKIGFNEHGLGVCLNFLEHRSEDPNRPYGVPVHVLLRAVMECETLEQAVKRVSSTPRCASANFLMAQHGGGGQPVAVDLEWTPTKVARSSLQDEMLVHTNHFKDAELKKGCGSGFGPSTMNRHAIAVKRAQQLRLKTRDPAERMKRILRDRTHAPLSVSKTATKKSRSQTLAGIVMDLSRNQLYLTSGPPHLNHFVSVAGIR